MNNGLWPIFLLWAFAALWVAPLVAAVAFIGTGAASTEGNGSVFALYYDREGSTVGDRSAGVSTSGAVSLCTFECWEECRKYKQGRRCETHCNSPFGDKDPGGNCTIVEAGAAGCGDDFLSTTQTVRGYGLGFVGPVVVVYLFLIGMACKRKDAHWLWYFLLYVVAALGNWLSWVAQQGALSLPACTSITTWLGASSGTTFGALGFYLKGFYGGYTLGAAILATIAIVQLGGCLVWKRRKDRRQQLQI